MKTHFTLTKYCLTIAVLSVGFQWLIAMPAQAQSDRKIVQLTGIVARGDSLEGISGVSVGVLRSNRRTVTDGYGYFSLPVLVGDSVAVRFQSQLQYVRIPEAYPNQSYSVIVQLDDSFGKSKTTQLTSVDLQRRILSLKLKEEPTFKLENRVSLKNLQFINKTATNKN